MSAINFGQDGSFSWEDLSARYTSELANGFGNLASRAIAMITKYFDGLVPAPSRYTDADLAIQRAVQSAVKDADAAMERLAIHEAIEAIWRVVDDLNGYITVQEPWVLAKSEDDRERLATVLYTVAEGLRALAVLLSPVMPLATTTLWKALGFDSALEAQPIREAGAWGQLAPGSQVETISPLFPRIETAPAQE